MRLLFRSLLLLLGGAVFFACVALFVTWAPDVPVEVLKPRWAQPPSQFVTVGGMQVHYRDEGPRDDPSPVVLLHGTSASLHTWQGWAAALRGQRRVIRMDLPGFGLTGPDPRGDYTREAYVRFVRDFADALGVKRFVLGGNSLGGEIAWASALAMPQRVDRLILVDAAGYPIASATGPIAWPPAFRIAQIPGLRAVMQRTLPRGVVDASVRSVYGDPSRVKPELVDLYVDMAQREGNRRALAQRMDARTTAGWEGIRDLKMPTLVLWGGQDRLLPREFGERFAKDIAGARLAVFESLGHVPQEEDPVATVAPVKAFLGLGAP